MVILPFSHGDLVHNAQHTGHVLLRRLTQHVTPFVIAIEDVRVRVHNATVTRVGHGAVGTGRNGRSADLARHNRRILLAVVDLNVGHIRPVGIAGDDEGVAGISSSP